MTDPVQEPITGGETLDNGESAFGALVEFYKAFNEGDLHLMAQNWLQTPHAAMSNPLGAITRGWSQIKPVYERIFDGPATVYVEFWDYTIFDGGSFFQAVGRERGRFAVRDQSVDLRIRTSRTFVKQGGRFRQLHHHGSIEEPELLRTYQNAVRGGGPA